MKKERFIYAILLMVFVTSISLTSCTKKEKPEEKAEKKEEPVKEEPKMQISKVSFGKTKEGTEVYLFSLKNESGTEVKITNYGGIITHIFTKDKSGKLGDIVLGYDSIRNYEEKHPYFGALIGRYANRIAKGKFTLDGKAFTLAKNDGSNHLHGGERGFDKVVWDAEEVKDASSVGVKLTYHSKDMEEGYPGNVTAIVTYSLTNDNELKIDYTAETDKKTPVNLTNHAYFNLGAGSTPNILDHELTIQAANYTPVDKTLIPTGEIKSVKGTDMDFTTAHKIGERIAKVEGGYDHNWVLDDNSGSLASAATLYEPTTGRVLEVLTTEPGLQFYSGNFLGVGGTLTGKGATKYVKHYGLCLEAQHFPDSPNKPKFPSTILAPGAKYTQTTIYKFSVK